MATSSLSKDQIVLDPTLYPEDCLADTCEAYKEFAAVSIERAAGSSKISVTFLTDAPDVVTDVLTLRRELLNYVLDLSIKRFLGS
jgi:hypothetical protein